MFSLTSFHRFYLYTRPADMRKSFDGLSGLVQSKLNRNPTSGEVFVFINKRRDRIKLLHWEPGGFVLYYKWLERGTLEMPDVAGDAHQISWPQLLMMIEGVGLKGSKNRVRFSIEDAQKMALK
jgi:transposase